LTENLQEAAGLEEGGVGILSDEINNKEKTSRVFV
jgi:hypothetical protein